MQGTEEHPKARQVWPTGAEVSRSLLALQSGLSSAKHAAPQCHPQLPTSLPLYMTSNISRGYASTFVWH